MWPTCSSEKLWKKNDFLDPVLGVNIPVKQFIAKVNLAKRLMFKVLLPDSSPLDHGTLGNLKRNTCHTPYLSLDDQILLHQPGVGGHVRGLHGQGLGQLFAPGSGPGEGWPFQNIKLGTVLYHNRKFQCSTPYGS